MTIFDIAVTFAVVVFGIAILHIYQVLRSKGLYK